MKRKIMQDDVELEQSDRIKRWLHPAGKDDLAIRLTDDEIASSKEVRKALEELQGGGPVSGAKGGLADSATGNAWRGLKSAVRCIVILSLLNFPNF